MTLPEVLLWRELRRRAGGVKFRKQHPCGPYVLDFYCAEAKLAIEIDGIVHDMGNEPDRDELRDMFLTQRGIATVRIPASEVLKSVGITADTIVSACLDRCSAPPPR